MTTIIFRVTTNFGYGPSYFHYNSMEAAEAKLDEFDNGEIDVLRVIHRIPLYYSDGCTWDELTYGVYDYKVNSVISLSDGYITYDGTDIVNATSFEPQWYVSVADAYKQCIDHDIECIQAGGGDITDIDENHIWYEMDGKELMDKVEIYDEDGSVLPYEELDVFVLHDAHGNPVSEGDLVMDGDGVYLIVSTSELGAEYQEVLLDDSGEVFSRGHVFTWTKREVAKRERM